MKWKVIGEWGVGWGVRVPCSAFEDLGLLRCRCREAGEWGGVGGGGGVGCGWGGVVAGAVFGRRLKMGNWETISRDFRQEIFVANLLGNSGLCIVFHIVYQATALFRFPRVPLPQPTRARVNGYLLV